MHRISTDAEWLKTGRVVVDADGVVVDIPGRSEMEAANQELEQRLETIENRASITWSYTGTGTPSISSYPGIKIGDYIVRKSDGQEWRVDA